MNINNRIDNLIIGNDSFNYLPNLPDLPDITQFSDVTQFNSDTIVFDYDNVATEVNNLISKRNSLLTGDSGEVFNLRTIFNRIKEGWEGKDSDSFVNKYNEEYEPYIKHIVAEIDNYIGSIKKVSNKLQDIENTLLTM